MSDRVNGDAFLRSKTHPTLDLLFLDEFVKV
jgi:hypothetical protein